MPVETSGFSYIKFLGKVGKGNLFRMHKHMYAVKVRNIMFKKILYAYLKIKNFWATTDFYN